MLNPRKLFQIIALVAGGLISAPAAHAADDAVLSLDAGGSQRSYTLEDLRALPASEIETTTIWTEGPQRFTGVSLHDLLNDADVRAGTIIATAINDYSIEIPVSDAIENGPIVAYERNGETMPRRGKGPLWILYPYDSNPDYQTETYFSRSIWQLDRIAVN